MANENPVNYNFIVTSCSAALNGVSTLQVAAANAVKYTAYFGGVLSQSDFINQYSSLTPVDIGNAITAIGAINTVLTSNNNQHANALTKIARSQNGSNFIHFGNKPAPTPNAQQIALGAKPANVSFISAVVSAASAGVNALTVAIALATQYSQYFSSALTQDDFVNSYSDLTPTDITNAMTAIGAVNTVLTANNNQLLNYLLTIAQ